MTLRTWHAEHAVVATVLAAVVLATHGGLVEWVGAGAVLAAFGHAAVGDRLAEREAARPVPLVHCYRKLGLYFVAKEALWFGYFVAHRSYSALVGCGVFLAYPVWRRWWRARHPLAVPP